LTEPEKKESPRTTEIAAFVGVMVSILVAVTTLLSNSVNLPEWWFVISLVLLILLAFSMPAMIFIRPVRKRIRQMMLERKLNGISRRYLPKLKDLVVKSRGFGNSIDMLLNNMRGTYGSGIKSQLASYALNSFSQNETSNATFAIEREIDESDKTYYYLCLLMKGFEAVLESYERGLKIYNIFAHEIMTTTDKPIAKGFEAEYEAFREKYNDFQKDVTDFCHNVNQETGRYDFPEHSFEYSKKL